MVRNILFPKNISIYLRTPPVIHDEEVKNMDNALFLRYLMGFGLKLEA
jgi:hypothetical protein